MGSGASTSRDSGMARTVRTKARIEEGKRRAGRHSKESDAFHNACMAVFKNADRDGNGVLSHDEFWSVLQSKTLNLNLSHDEMEEIRRHADVDSDGQISYEEFIPVVKDLLKRVYQGKDSDWNDWCMIKDNDSGRIMYMNKRTGQVQDRKPENYREERMEERSFEYIELADGTEVTTFVDDNGQRLYMDWDTQQWLPFPDEWYPKSHTRRSSKAGLLDESTTEDEFLDEENDPRVGEYIHPTLGTLTTYLFENTRNTRLYFDESLGQWARMPLAWERRVPEVLSQLEELDKAFPHWQNVGEQLLVLRECNYDIQDAMVFTEINFNAVSEAEASETVPTAPVRSKTIFAPKDKVDGADTGTMSVTAAARIDELEAQLAAKEKELVELRALREEQEETQLKQISREKTKVETEAQRLQRLVGEAQDRADELSEENRELQKKVADLEQQLVAHQADREKIESMEKQLAAASSGESNALKEKTSQLEQLRTDNVALKLKVKELKNKLTDPTKSSETVKLISTYHKKVTALREEKNAASSELQTNVTELSELFSRAVQMSKQLSTNVHQQLEDITAKYRKEQIQRKLLYNKVQELRGNIRVFCRVRKDDRGKCVFQFPSETELVIQKLQGGTELMEFDRCYGPKTSQSQVFDDTKPTILSSVDGYNVCIMAYGQTGSGKTFTMMGPEDNPGVNRRAIKELFEVCGEREEVDYTITVSMMEVYNEKLFDLLADSRTAVDLHVGPEGVYVDGLVEKDVSSQEEIEKIMQQGDANRSSAATKMNTDSSRSHLLFQIVVSGYNRISKATSRGKLTLVDLAGSERVSKSEASGDRLVEAAAINKSLTSLGQVFKALASNAPHVPYRNSKLTHVLQDSLGGDSKTCLFVNVSPLESNLSETHCTLRFGVNTRKIELGPAKKHRGPGPSSPGKKPNPNRRK